MPRDENDSGQGSSLDKDYALYNNAQQYKSSPYARGGGSNSGGYGSSSQNGGGPYASAGSGNVQNGGQYSTNGGQFYYNVPPNSSAPPPPPTGGPPATPQRRPDGLDLSNRCGIERVLFAKFTLGFVFCISVVPPNLVEMSLRYF